MAVDFFFAGQCIGLPNFRDKGPDREEADYPVALLVMASFAGAYDYACSSAK